MYIPEEMPTDYKSNGCGSGWNAKIVPDSFKGFDVTEACRVHDYMYGKGGIENDRYIADALFLANMLSLINEQDKWYLPEVPAIKIAVFYYQMVREYGEKSFNFKEK